MIFLHVLCVMIKFYNQLFKIIKELCKTFQFETTQSLIKIEYFCFACVLKKNFKQILKYNSTVFISIVFYNFKFDQKKVSVKLK